MSQAELPDRLFAGFRGYKLPCLFARLPMQWTSLLDRAMDKWSGLLLFFRLYLTLKCESPL